MRLPKYLKGFEVRKIDEKETRERSKIMARITNESVYGGACDEKQIESAYLSCSGAVIGVFDGNELAAFSKMFKLPDTNTAYLFLIAQDKKYRGTGLFSSSLHLPIGQGLEWGCAQVACATANNKFLELIAKIKFVYMSEKEEDRGLMREIASERFGRKIELIDGFILDGTVLGSYPNVPAYKRASDERFNELFKPPFIRKRCDRRLMFRRLDEEAENDYLEWLSGL